MTAKPDAWFAIVPEYVAYCGNPRAIQVFAIMHRHAGDTQEAWPSRRRLAELAGCTPKTIDRAIADLEDLGAVTTVRRHRDDGSWTSNLYTLHMTGAVSVQTRIPFGTSMGGARDIDGARGSGVSVQGVGPTMSHHESEPLNQTHRNDYQKELFGAVCVVCGVDWNTGLTKTQKGRIGTAVGELMAIEATPEQVIERGVAYRDAFPGMALTPQALVKHWSTVGAAAMSEEAVAKARRAMMETPTGRNLPA